MWTILDKNDLAVYADRVLSWSQYLSISAFPIFCDGIKKAEDILDWARASFERDNEEILVYTENGICLAWLHYFYQPLDKQLGVCSFFITEQVERLMTDLLVYLQQQYSGFQWNVYVPNENQELIAYLNNHFPCIDDAYVDILKHDKTIKQTVWDEVITVTRENFFLLEEYGQTYLEKCYWSPEQLLSWSDDWLILLGSGLLIAKRHDSMDEIFFSNGENADACKKLISTCIADAEGLGKSVYFFTNEKEHDVAVELGFETVTQAKCFEIKIR